MSELYNPRYTRGGYGKYNRNKNFITMEAGTDAFFLEDEANEMQWMQNELRADLIRKEYYSGVYKKETNDIISSASIFSNNSQIFNSFLIKPIIANINGYFIDVIGNNGYKNQGDISGIYDNIDIKKLNYIQLPDPPKNGNYYDFIYLEMNFVELRFSDTIWFNGNRNNSFGSIPNDLFDRRVNGETNRRIQLQWNINVARVPMDHSTFTGALFDESMNAIYTPAKGSYHKNSLYGFWNATTSLDNKTDSDDIGLWIAGKGLQYNDEIAPLHTINGYSYAIPLFKVIRRNTELYNPTNLLGSTLAITDENTFSNRPDGKFANIIYSDDIIDLRNIIRINNISKVLHENFENLLLNNTNYETKLYSTFFGIDKVETSESTLLYEGCNKEDFNSDLLRGTNYIFTPGVEQEAIIFGKNTYLEKSFNAYNVNIKGLTIQFFIKVINNCGLFTIINNKTNKVQIIAYIENNNLFIVTDYNLIHIDFTKYYNKFTHIAVAMRDNSIEAIINNKSIINIQPINFSFNDQFTVQIGYAQIKNYFCENTLFDEIEIANIYKNQFNRIPKSIGEDNADITIDPQLARKNYTLINKSDTYTFHKKFKSNNKGILEFAISLPLTLTFTDDIPIIYFDNESVQVDKEVNVAWTKNHSGETDEHPYKWYCTITGLGSLVTYNLVIIAYVNYPANQGLSHLPIKAYATFAEKESKIFYAVADVLETQEHLLNYTRKNSTFNIRDKLITYNPYIYKYGFCTLLKYTKFINANQFSMLANEYTKTVAIFSIIYNGKNVLDSYSCIDDSYAINLTKYISGEIEIYFITNQNCCIYSPSKLGIINLYQIEEINDFGNGTRKEFTYRSNTRISSFLQSQFNNTKYHYVFVNGLPTKVSVTIDGSFVHYKFSTPPINKANIRTYIVSEYDPC